MYKNPKFALQMCKLGIENGNEMCSKRVGCGVEILIRS